MGDNEARAPTDEKRSMFNQPEGVDWLLAWVANLVELDVGLDVTLSAGGTVLSGTVISAKSYFEEVASAFAVREGDESAPLRKVMADSFRTFGEHADAKSKDEALETPRRYIHLKNVAILNDAGSTLPLNGALWRGKLAAIEGFTIGRMASS